MQFWLHTGVLAMLASFCAEERHVLTPPWTRLGVAGCAALLAGPVVGHEGGIDWPTCVVTGVAAAVAFGTGLLLHELAWRIPALSFFLRFALLSALERSSWLLIFKDIQPGRPIARIPPTLEAVDVAALIAAFAIAAVLHARVRRRAAIL